MSDPIADILQSENEDSALYSRKHHEDIAKQIRQQIGRELLKGESWAVPRHKVVEVCQMEAQSDGDR